MCAWVALVKGHQMSMMDSSIMMCLTFLLASIGMQICHILLRRPIQNARIKTQTASGEQPVTLWTSVGKNALAIKGAKLFHMGNGVDRMCAWVALVKGHQMSMMDSSIMMCLTFLLASIGMQICHILLRRPIQNARIKTQTASGEQPVTHWTSVGKNVLAIKGAKLFHMENGVEMMCAWVAPVKGHQMSMMDSSIMMCVTFPNVWIAKCRTHSMCKAGPTPNALLRMKAAFGDWRAKLRSLVERNAKLMKSAKLGHMRALDHLKVCAWVALARTHHKAMTNSSITQCVPARNSVE